MSLRADGDVRASPAVIFLELELELDLIQTHMTQKPALRVEVGACRFAQQTSTAKS